MDFIKSKLNMIIAIICIVLFGFLYLNKINRQEVITAHSSVQASSLIEDLEASSEEEEPLIKIHIMGAVMKPGVYEVKEGARVVDAIEAAGGERADADLESVNLAKILEDEMQVRIPQVGENIDKTETTVQNDKDSIKNEESLVNINRAGKHEIMSLPGIGEVTAGNIIAYREANGSFKNTEDIKKVNRIGEKTFERIKDLITVD